ncbi:hypothetical protein IAQ61_009118 [Plenodomus lingam]|nr:hypothetical protein IAQ61_009118 [Plenodomus lingam]
MSRHCDLHLRQPPLPQAMNACTEQTPLHDDPVRICFSFKSQDIPGEPGARPITLANAFMEPTYGRKFDWDRDHFYTPAGIDEVGDSARRSLYMFLDINKHANPSSISLRCVKVVKKDLLTFKDTNFNGALKFSKWYPWGGRDSVQQQQVSQVTGD